MTNHTILVGDCVDRMRTLPAAHAQVCVTSPPYFGLRDYGIDGQLGREATPAEYVSRMVDVFREVKRVLRPDGTLWVNLGDSYSTGSKWGGSTSGKHVSALHGGGGPARGKTFPGLPDKNLIGIPWRVALALQADGWYLRSDIIWHKPSVMPQSVTDRCTTAHEYLFMLAHPDSGGRYFFDHAANREPAVQAGRIRADRFGGNKYVEGVKHSDGSVFTGATDRNRRSVWTIATVPYKGAHFATFPPALVAPCILAGSRAGDLVLDPFLGSGTTLAVAKQHGRHGVGCELNPEYAALAVGRLQAV